jgi:hypothetical protein
MRILGQRHVRPLYPLERDLKRTKVMGAYITLRLHLNSHLLIVNLTTLSVVQARVKGKGKAIPLQAWTGPEGSRRLRLRDFKTVSIWRW